MDTATSGRASTKDHRNTRLSGWIADCYSLPPMNSFPRLLPLVPLVLTLGASACSSSSAPSDMGTPNGGGAGSPGVGGAGAAGAAGAADGGAGGAAGSDGTGGVSAGGVSAGGASAGGASAGGSASTGEVTFSYKPSWPGVTAVTVLGGFGQADDWKAPFVTLTNDGTGQYTGMASLPDGVYPYVFRVTGDAAAATPTKSLFAIDPGNPAFVACPMGSPTFTTAAPNPCSALTVPQPPAATTNHVTGTVTSGGKPAPGWLIEFEREEPKSHHFFVDRVATGADGSFDLAAALGNYRLQALPPDFYSTTDATRVPAKEATARRAISGAFSLASAVAVVVPDVAFTKYAMFKAPSPPALPAAFSFNDDPATILDVYGPGANIGDPWFTSKPTATGMASFDGNFTTKQAKAPMVVKGTSYFWGTETAMMTSSGKWLVQSLVFPITWM